MDENRKYTGYRDCEGKPIFEGDIIHDQHYVGYGKRNHYYQVIFINGEAGMINIHNRTNYTSFKSFTFTSEAVIGNKFDNPEYLK